jgi:hypothetical protein
VVSRIKGTWPTGSYYLSGVEKRSQENKSSMFCFSDIFFLKFLQIYVLFLSLSLSLHEGEHDKARMRERERCERRRICDLFKIRSPFPSLLYLYPSLPLPPNCFQFIDNEDKYGTPRPMTFVSTKEV